jgi:hypothetical protein
LSAAVSLLTGVAFADGGPKITDSLWMPVGVNLGWAANSPVPSGFLAGPEVSFVYLDQSGPWVGVYADALYDGGRDRTRLSVGAEAGYAILGLDVGYVSTALGDREHGVRGRLLLSFAAVHLYGGLGRLADSTYGEVGVLIKIPLQIWAETPRRPWMDRPERPSTYEPSDPPPASPGPPIDQPLEPVPAKPAEPDFAQPPS